MSERKTPTWVPWLISTVSGIAGVFAFIYGVVDEDLKGCTIVGLPPRLTLSLFAIAAVSGWALFLSQAIPSLMVAFRKSPSSVAATDGEVCARLERAKSVQIFVSRSDRMRSLVTTHAKKLSPGLKLQVLVREDGTSARDLLIAAEAQKWRDDVGKFGVTLQIRTYKFDPIMFRGLIFDRQIAILGWYFRGEPLKQGHDLDMFSVPNVDVVEQISSAFDDMFARGRQL